MENDQLDQNRDVRLEKAQRWLDRAIDDFNAFKRFVGPFDNKTKGIVTSCDPALASYLLQQCIEKIIKAELLASGQIDESSLRKSYRHNSLALALKLYLLSSQRIIDLKLTPFASRVGVDLDVEVIKLGDLEIKVRKNIPIEEQVGETISKESLRITVPVLDSVLDMLIRVRTANLEVSRTSAKYMKENEKELNAAMNDESRQMIIERIINGITTDMGVKALSQDMLNAPLELLRMFNELGYEYNPDFEERRMKQIMLGEWSSLSLLFLSYFTFAHEGITRYPGDSLTSNSLGCDDYEVGKVALVSRFGKFGYVTQLTLSEIRNELLSIQGFFTSND
jgi:hypothetical protein